VIVMAKHIREPAVPVRVIAPDRRIPGSVEAVVTRALEKDPNMRFQTADEFDQALEACRADIERAMAGRVERISFADRLRHVPHEEKRTVAIVGGSLVAGVVLAALGYLLLRSPPVTTVKLETPSAVEVDDPMVMVESDPIHATVWFADQVLGVTPIAVVLPEGKPMRVELRKEGYAMAQVDVTADNTSLRITLDPLPTTPTAAAATDDTQRARLSPATRATQASGAASRDRNKKVGAAPYERFE